MFNKKSASKTTATGPFVELADQATRLEEAGNWGDAAQVWQRIASHKNASKKTRAEAKGRAAAARVRAAAKLQGTPGAESVVAEVPVADTPETTATPTDAPVDEAATPNTPPASDAPTGDPGANVAPPTDGPPAPKPRDPRLPKVGTVIQKRDRKGELRCECKLVEDGIEYKGTTYKSLSAAALAASKDLGLGASTLDGWAWWGLKERPAVPAAKRDLGATLERAFSKYRERVAGIVQGASGDDLIKVGNLLKAQGAELIALVEPAESASS